jgi:dipeptidyl aminopeptidase/acylaminoacyl peptidase
VADLQISDGRQIVYVLVEVNEKEDRYDTSLWAVAAAGGSEPRRLTAGPRDAAPRWSPDSSTLAFLRAPGEKDRPQIHLLPMNGGEARKLTDVPRGASAPVWSPTGKAIAFTSATNCEDLEEQKRDGEGRRGEGGNREERRPRRGAGGLPHNGAGLARPSHRDHIWTVSTVFRDAPAPATPVTRGRYDERELFWSATARRSYFTSIPSTAVRAFDSTSTRSRRGRTSETVVDISGPVSGASRAGWLRIAFVGFSTRARSVAHARRPLRVREGKRPR